MPSISLPSEMSAAQISSLYEEEYKGSTDDYLYLLNGFREHADRIAFVMGQVKSFAPKSVLDIACNRGLFGALCNWNHQKLEKLVGVDISPTMARLAMELHGYDTVLVYDVGAPFDLEEKFDLILCMEILEHVKDPQAVIANAFKHLAVGGHIIFSTPEEEGEVDGVIHVRHLPLRDLTYAIAVESNNHIGSFNFYDHFLPSLFCEKPHWKGWNSVTVERTA